MRMTLDIVHKSQLPQLFTNHKLQMAPLICIGGTCDICEQLSFVNNQEPVAKPLAQLLFEPLNTRKYERNSRISFRVFRVFRGFAIASICREKAA